MDMGRMCKATQKGAPGRGSGSALLFRGSGDRVNADKQAAVEKGLGNGCDGVRACNWGAIAEDAPLPQTKGTEQ